MKFRAIIRGAGLAGVVLLAVAFAGCSKKSGIHTIVPNRRPSVELTSAPVDTRDTAFYAYRINWSGDDPDGRVDHFEYAIDPGAVDTAWSITKKNEDTFFFKSSQPVLGGAVGQPTYSIDPHRFVIRAVDNLGLTSEPKARYFFSKTVAPTVQITSPQPTNVADRLVTPSVRITWFGKDPDGQFTQKPIKYKFKLFADGNPEFDLATMLSATRQLNGADSLRRYYAAQNFAGWDSVGGDTTETRYTGLKPDSRYVFVVVGFDEAGAYSPNFSQTSNMLRLEVGFAGNLGPKITAFNEFFLFQPKSGGFTPDNPVSWFSLEIPADGRTTFNWFATSDNGVEMQWYRWRLDGNVADETDRTGIDDWYHWSSKSVSTTSCTIGPFTPGIDHKLYIEAFDNVNLLSIMTIVLHPVRPTFHSELLIVDDTRLEPDKFDAGPGITNQYGQVWPSAAELDTFYYARGGVPWRSTQVTVPAPVTTPGLFAGYTYDTLGTRQGLEIASNGVSLSRLGEYKRLVWMVDKNSSLYSATPLDPNKPIGTLQWMCQRNHLNTLGTYIASGGTVWFLGGDAAAASLQRFNVPANDTKYGLPIGRVVYSSEDAYKELVPGRLLYDAVHWQSELCYQPITTSSTQIVKAVKVPTRAWTSPGWHFQRSANPITSPDYTRLPAQMRLKSASLGDLLPPTRLPSQSAQFYNTGQINVEFISAANSITEDFDPSVRHDSLASALDSLMDVRGSSVNNVPGEKVTMTYYHGVNTPEIIYTGFNLWGWTRSDCQAIVDFVLNGIWKLPIDQSARTVPNGSRWQAPYPAHANPANLPLVNRSRLSAGRLTGR